MPIDIAKFHSVATEAGNRDLVLGLTESRKDLFLADHQAARWVRDSKTSPHHEVSELFVHALHESYGEGIAQQVIEATDLNSGLKAGHALTSMKVMRAVDIAESIKQQFVVSNKEMVSDYVSSLWIGSSTSPLQMKCDGVAAFLFSSHKDEADAVKAKFDFGELDRKFKEKIQNASIGGTHVVTAQEAGKITDLLINEQMRLTYLTLLMERMDISREGSIGQRAWSRVNPDPESGLRINLSGDNDIARRLNDQFVKKLSKTICPELNTAHAYGGNQAANAPVITMSPEDLAAIAKSVVEEFAGERFAAAQAAQELPVEDEGVKSRMIQEILHGNMSASMVPVFCRVYPRLSQHFPALGRNQDSSPQELEKALVEMHHAARKVMHEGKLKIEDRDAAMRSLWNAFLLGQDAASLHGIVHQMSQEGSLLRTFGQGAHYFRYVFGQSDFCQRRKQAETYASSIDTAGDYSLLLNNLAKVLQNKTDSPEPLAGVSSVEKLSDETITILRNLDIKILTPKRLGEKNGSVRLPNQVWNEIQSDLKSESTSKKELINGVVEGFMSDLKRANYRLQGEDLGVDADKIMDRLREFCTDKSGESNEEMLLAISKFAYQATFGILQSFLGLGREHLAPFWGVPVKQRGMMGTTRDGRAQYDIGKTEKGEVVIHMQVSQPIIFLTSPDIETGEQATIQLKPDVSRFGMSLDISLVAKTFEPTLNKASMSYAFYPDESASAWDD